jgi:hypothetical protein
LWDTDGCRSVESQWRDIYVTARIVTCDWRDPEVLHRCFIQQSQSCVETRGSIIIYHLVCCYMAKSSKLLHRHYCVARKHSDTNIFLLQICSGTATVAFTTAPYCTSTTTTTNPDSVEKRNVALISILGESQYYKTNLMNIYAFHQSDGENGQLSSETDETIIMKRTENEKAAPVKLVGIPSTRSSLTPSSGCYFPCS